MYTVNLIRYNKIVQTYQVSSIRLHLAQLAYVSVSNGGNTYNVVMAVKNDCDIVSLSTGNVGEIQKGLA